ncbi:glucosidase II beta subunit-like protein-domain-containing protein [Aspergillus bertholletiae]|uniref:Endoplasmic reticulum lectin n=1 Tax=Aspergillus bertholletiae TaxID=1226010 RepID=A0A5N7BMP0_9EURO|nr:glucosidase II beta subunit-like protein-domain-containing protein [Aspergillus bertholletiae]
MGRRNRIVASLLTLACATSTALANKKAFNIHDDLLAFPQFQVLFPDEYILDTHAKELLQTQTNPPVSDDQQGHSLQKSQIPLKPHTDESQKSNRQQEKGLHLTYEELILQDQRFLCQIPQVEGNESSPTNETKESHEVDEKQELARATDRGLELLSEMEGKCMYYVSGWWSYSFCYKKQIKQFHALPSGSGIPSYPPMEDPATHSFILGRFPRANDEEDGEAERKRTAETTTTTTAAATDVAELQTNGGSRYLVQHLEGGTKCDLTGKNRKIEVQFHCHPQSTDRIGWIKELTTCSYLMVIYTPRLCNDVAFLPPQQEEVHSIECREILSPEEVPDWEAMRQYHLAQQLVESAATMSEFPIIGDIEVGAKKLVGTEGKEIEKGRVASAGEEKVEVVAKRENGEVLQLSKVDLEKLGLDPEKIETLKTRLEELAQGKDWTLEHVTANGERGLRGIVDTDEDEEEEKEAKPGTESKDVGIPEEPQEKTPIEKEVPAAKSQDEPKEKTQSAEDVEEGSEEIFKDEL